MNEMENRQKISEDGKVSCRHIGGIHTETGSDMILPDYMGDIKRLLSYKASVLPIGGLGDSPAAYSGTVEYKVLYIDSEGELTEAAFTSDYEYSAKTGEECIGSIEKPEITSLTVRASGPRKLSAKAILSSDVIIMCEDESSSIILPESAVLKKNTVNSAGFLALENKELELAEEIKLEGIGAEEIDLVSSGSEFVFEDSEFSEGSVRVCGSVDAYAILRLGGSSLTRVEKSIPFEAELECPVREGRAFPVGCISSLHININNDGGQNGACTSLVFSVIAELGANVLYTEKREIVEDGFIPNHKCENSYGRVEYLEAICADSLAKPLSFEVERGRECEACITEIIAVEPTLKTTSERVEEGYLVMAGEISFLTLCGSTESHEPLAIRTSHGFEIREKLNTPECEGAKRIIRKHVLGSKVSLDSGKLYIKCRLCLEYLFFKNREARSLMEMKNIEGCKADDSTVRIYYPENGESLWSVAKKYGISPEELCRENSISPDLSLGADLCMSGVVRLAIVKN